MDRRLFIRTALTGAVGLAAGTATASLAEAAVPVFLGRRKVDPFADQDTIHVGAGKGFFRKISFHASGNDVFVYDVRVDYSLGGAQHFNTRFKINQGTSSRKLDLRFNRRFVQDVRFRYGKLLNGKGVAHVEVWGWR